MAFIELGGHEVAALISDGVVINNMAIGSMSRSLLGRLLRAEWAEKRELKITTPPMSLAEADALKQWVTGKAETWSFESAANYQYGSRGSGFLAGSGYSRVAVAKFGSFGLSMPSTSTVTLGRSISGSFSVLAWHRDNDTLTWRPIAIVVDGVASTTTKYVDGGTPAGTDDPANVINVAGSNPILSDGLLGGGSDDGWFDDVVVADFAVPPSIIASHAAGTRAMSAFRKHTMSGDILVEDSIQVYAFSPSVQPVATASGMQYKVEVLIKEV